MMNWANGRPHYWTRHTDGEGHWLASAAFGPPGEELAALRQGSGRVPGTVPAMWPYYTTLRADGAVTRLLCAEHVVLSLFAVHQQSQAEPMHRNGIGLGTAMLGLRRSERHRDQPESLDRRFAAAATAVSLTEVSVHLRSLVTLLRREGLALDYTRLFHDLDRWQIPPSQGRVRRRWGSQYFAWGDDTSGPREPQEAVEPIVAAADSAS